MAFWNMPLPGLMRKTAVALPVFVSSSTVTGSSASTIFDKPAGVQPGDFMVVIAAGDNFTAPTTTGWTLQYYIASNPYFAVFSKVAGGSEPANYTFNTGGGASNTGVVCLAYRGGGAVFDQVGVRSASVTANPTTAPSMTTSSQGILVAAFVAQANTVALVTPVGMTNRGDAYNVSVYLATYDLSPSPAGVTGNKNLNWNSGGFPRAGLQLQIR